MIDWSREKYVSLRTFRKDGTGVDVPVWIAELDSGEVAFSTDPSSWKVKRAKRDSRVELRPCTMRGQVAPDAPVVSGTARVIGAGAEYDSVVAALRQKYGLQVALIEFGGRIKQFVKRSNETDCALVISVEGPVDA